MKDYKPVLLHKDTHKKLQSFCDRNLYSMAGYVTYLINENIPSDSDNEKKDKQINYQNIVKKLYEDNELRE